MCNSMEAPPEEDTKIEWIWSYILFLYFINLIIGNYRYLTELSHTHGDSVCDPVGNSTFLSYTEKWECFNKIKSDVHLYHHLNNSLCTCYI